MAVSYRIAVIGDWESVMGFRALGLDAYPASSPEEAREIIQKLAREDSVPWAWTPILSLLWRRPRKRCASWPRLTVR